MAWKKLKQRSLADDLVSEHEALTELDDVNDFMDWQAIEDLLCDIHAKRRGNSAWPPLFMFKALLLQSWHNLSDPGLEKKLARDLLFRRFVGLSLADSVPDHRSIWRFRQLLEKQGADGKRKTTYGFKAHINVDEDGFSKATVFTAGNVHDSNHFTELLSGDESAVYADSAYKSRKHDEWLEERGIDNRVMGRAYRNTPLTKAQKQKNHRNAGVRCTVERVFGVFKLYYGMGQARYLGLARNAVRFGLMCFAYNLKRGINIQRSCNPSQYSCA